MTDCFLLASFTPRLSALGRPALADAYCSCRSRRPAGSDNRQVRLAIARPARLYEQVQLGSSGQTEPQWRRRTKAPPGRVPAHIVRQISS